MSAMSGGQASYYLGLGREDYYLQGGEPPGQWYGEGAAALGLTGPVEADHLYNLFAGRSPWGDRSLIQRQNHARKAEHRPGWDLTFSAPKSVSVLWSQAEEPVRAVLQSLHARAVQAALEYLQDTAASTRRGKGGKVLEPGGLIVSTFEHSTSRALDPQLHTHALVMNLCVRKDGTTGTLSSLDLFLSKMAAGALYRAELARGLREELGLLVRRERSWFEVEGVPRDLIETFSKRREAIEEALRKTGLTSAAAAAAAAIQTRTAKQGASRFDLFQEWRAEGMRHGWSTAEAGALSRPQSSTIDRLDRTAVAAEVCRLATDRLTGDAAHFTRRDFVRYLAEEAQGRGLGAAEVRQAADAFLSGSRSIIRLGEHRGEERFTTRAMLELERELLGGADTLRRNGSHRLEPETVMGIIARQGAALSEEQLKAVWHVTSQSGALAVVSGMAGTGKTRMLEMARSAWEADGYRVEGAALAARAAKELTSGSGIPADTIARTLMDLASGKKKIDGKTILVVDEAGMVATPDMRRLILACREAGTKLVLVGDERQLQPIGPGAPFLELGERHGRAELKDIRRQNDEWARVAVKDMAAGRAREALAAFAERGLVKVSQTRNESMVDLVARWRSDGGNPEETLILAGTRNEVRNLNRLVQEQRLQAKELGQLSTLIDNERIHLGDRVMFTKNRRALGVENGAKGTVCGLSGDGERMSVRLDNGEKVTLWTPGFVDLTLGYAATTHKAQGATTARTYVLGGGPMQARELSYVQASRAKVETRFFATAAETGDDIANLAREMERSRQKEMAHAVLRRQENKSSQPSQPSQPSKPSPAPEQKRPVTPTRPVSPVRPEVTEVAPKPQKEVPRVPPVPPVPPVQTETEQQQPQRQSHERRRR